MPLQSNSPPIETHKIPVTRFDSVSSLTQHPGSFTLIELVDHIRKVWAKQKSELPLLKLGLFGSKTTAKGAIRSNENLQQISGIEIDYDGGVITFEEAVVVMEGVGLRCILYTTPSYLPGDNERWRILLPLSQLREVAVREKFVARINGLFDGQIGKESFTASQAFYYGHVAGAPFQAIGLPGDFIDLRDDLYAKSIFKDGSRVGDPPTLNGNGHDHAPDAFLKFARSGDRDYGPPDIGEAQAALDAVDPSTVDYTGWIKVAAALHHGFGEAGFALFDRWSSRDTGKSSDGSPRYSPKLAHEKWKATEGMRSVHIASLFFLAKEVDPDWMLRYRARTGNVETGESQATGSQPNNQTPQTPLIGAKPFVWLDPTQIPRRQWVYGRHLIRQFASATFAPSGAGKTNTFIVEALAMATGRELLGSEPFGRFRVWLWNGEDPYDELQRRIAAACLHYKIAREDLDGWLFVNSGRDRDSRLVIARQDRGGVTIHKPVVEALVKTIRDNAIDVVMIDPFISSHQVIENDNAAIDAVAKEWSGIADVTNTAIELGHHTRKTGGAEVTVEDGRGAVALLNAVRPARVINGMTEDEAKQARVKDGRKRYFRIADGKNNLSLPSDQVDWFRSATVNLGNVNPLNPLDVGDEMGVITRWQWPDPLEGVTGGDFDRVAAVIRGAKWREDTRAKDWVGIAVAQALQMDPQDDADVGDIKGMLKIWIKAGTLELYISPDEHRHPKTYVRVVEDNA